MHPDHPNWREILKEEAQEIHAKLNNKKKEETHIAPEGTPRKSHSRLWKRKVSLEVEYANKCTTGVANYDISNKWGGLATTGDRFNCVLTAWRLRQAWSG